MKNKIHSTNPNDAVRLFLKLKNFLETKLYFKTKSSQDGLGNQTIRKKLNEPVTKV